MAEGVKPLSRMMLRTQECSGLSLTGLKVALKRASVVGYHRGTEPTKFLFRSVTGKEIAGPGASHAGRERFKNLKKKQILTNGHF